MKKITRKSDEIACMFLSGPCHVRCHHDCYRWQCHCACHGPRTAESIKERMTLEEKLVFDYMGIPYLDAEIYRR
jgi:hypothetical protein